MKKQFGVILLQYNMHKVKKKTSTQIGALPHIQAFLLYLFRCVLCRRVAPYLLLVGKTPTFFLFPGIWMLLIQNIYFFERVSIDL